MRDIPIAVRNAGTWNEERRRVDLTRFFNDWNDSMERAAPLASEWANVNDAKTREMDRAHQRREAELSVCQATYDACTQYPNSDADACARAFRACQDAAKDRYSQDRIRIERTYDPELIRIDKARDKERDKQNLLLTRLRRDWTARGGRFAEIVERAGSDLTPPVKTFAGVSRAPCLGTPGEMFPDLVYVGPPLDRSKAPDDFVTGATEFHTKTWGLATTPVDSLLQIIEDLGTRRRRHRVRLVAHGTDNVMNTGKVGLNLAMFTGTQIWIDEEALEALATSDIAIVEFMADPLAEFSKKKAKHIASTVVRRLSRTAFGSLSLSGRSHELDVFIAYTAVLATKNALAKVPARKQGDFRLAIALLTALYTVELGKQGAKKKDVESLAAAVKELVRRGGVRLTPLSFKVTREGPDQPLAMCIRAVKGGLRKKIESARRAFHQTAFFDIRGCEIGARTDELLRPWGHLFGLPASHVSAPTRFVGYLPSDQFIPMSWPEVLPATLGGWEEDAMTLEAPRLPMDEDWILEALGKKMWRTTSDLTKKLSAYCAIALVIIAVESRRVRLCVFRDVPGTTEQALRAVARSMWANPPEAAVKSLVARWRGGERPYFPTLLGTPDIFPWQPEFAEGIVRGNDR
jgi:hypothetical protein